MKEYTENGRSMLEMLGVLAVIGVITIGGFDMITKMNDQRKATQIMDNVGFLTNKARILVREYYSDYDTNNKYIFTKYICGLTSSAGKEDPTTLSDDLTCKGSSEHYKITSKNDEYYYLFANNHLKNVLYVLGIYNLSENTCMELAAKNWGSPSTNGFIGLSIPNKYNINEADNNEPYMDLDRIISGLQPKYKDSVFSIVGNSTYPVPMPAATNCADGATIFLTFK